MTSSYEEEKNIFKKILKNFFSLFGFRIVRKNNFHERRNNSIVEINEEDKININRALEISLCRKENIWSLIQSINYISDKKIQGDVVECGVFKGGSLGIICSYVQKNKLNSKIYGFDTFEQGFLDNTISEKDFTVKGKKVDPEDFKAQKNFYPSKQEVEKNLEKFNLIEKYQPILIKGNILETLKKEENLPKKISLLRLDTDLYNTTKLQLKILYPRLEKGGILHIDDYGLCQGVRSAVDEYFYNKKIWLHRVDLTCRLMIKD